MGRAVAEKGNFREACSEDSSSGAILMPMPGGWKMRFSIAIALGLASIAPTTAATRQIADGPAASRDGQKDFDWENGSWTTKVRVRRNPLSSEAPVWVEYQGISIVKPVSEGRANLVELSVAGPNGKIEGVSLRLYNPQARQWSLNFASYRDGLLTAPVYGSFDATGRGLFYGQDTLDGRAILVRFVITRVSPNEARFDQAYSADGGVTWEDNWNAVDRRR
jgi:hypothetical protein